MQRTIGLNQQFLKLQSPFPGNFRTQLRFGSNLFFRIVLICFLDASAIVLFLVEWDLTLVAYNVFQVTPRNGCI